MENTMEANFKLQPRNATAWQTALITGNTVTTRLEAGVGNCFPGLECDIRNLERRFFPHLAVDFFGNTVVVAEVDIQSARSAGLPPAALALYEAMAQDVANPDPNVFWIIDRIEGDFGPFGRQDLRLRTLGGVNQPSDAWTAIRLLPEGQDVTLTLARNEQPSAGSGMLRAPREPYIDASGALNSVFQPGELTQSLCSPWTHDFRDCGCFYWASNHPDIAQPERPFASPPTPTWDQEVPWQRALKGTLVDPPAPAMADAFGDEMQHYEINHRWPELAVVLDGREQGDSYVATQFTAVPFDNVQDLERQIRYAAGVELGVTLEYLSAAYSLNQRVTTGTLADDIRASFAELMRIAFGEMRHLRAVNDLLRGLFERGLIATFVPALQVAAELPAGGRNGRPLSFRRLTRATLQDFIDIERPSFSVDGLYARILATLRRDAPGALAAVAEVIMAEGSDHFETFSFIQEWLRPHNEADYLLGSRAPDNTVAAHNTLQTHYAALLNTLHRGYQIGLPGGAELIAQARADMLSPTGIRGACEALANAGFLVTFVAPNDPRFTPINRPETIGLV
jgi:hypothetical protein